MATRANLPIIYPEIRLDYKLATLPSSVEDGSRLTLRARGQTAGGPPLPVTNEMMIKMIAMTTST
jgi:hypothetical protein